MKYLFAFLSVLTLSSVSSFVNAQDLSGAWKIKGSENHLLFVQDGYFSWTETNNNKEFVNTMGGRVTVGDNQLNVKIEFNADDRYMVGDSYTVRYKLTGDNLEIQHPEGYNMDWERIKEKDQGLARSEERRVGKECRGRRRR